MSNILIIESENDKFFIEALINNLNLNIEIDTPICLIDEYEYLGGISKLENSLKALKGRISKGDGINKIGIIFDADKVGITERTEQIQEKINLVFNNEKKINFFIYILNIDGNGELETVLKEIKSKDSTIADCLDSWQNCLIENNKKLKLKDFNKFWVQVYQRYDCCSKKEQKQAGKKCNNEVSLKNKDIWDLNHKLLDNLNNFLKDLGN